VCVRAYVRTLVCATVLRFTCLTEKDQGVPDTAVSLLFMLLRFLVYRKGEGQVAPLFEKKLHGIVDVQHHPFSYKELWT
jgi:hypothetical protein